MMNQQKQGFELAIMQIIAELSTVKVGDIKETDRLREDLGLDSVSSMELLSMLAEQFDLDIPLEEAMEVTTVAGVIEMGRKRLGPSAEA
ncbi:acyl carrier protein [Myxococcota bacterium]|nr:acyl carrier protein [Myxococcota bacterium]